MKQKELTNPKHGQPIDTAGMPVTMDPNAFEGGVCIENRSVPPDHPGRQVWREMSPEEIKQREKDEAGAVSFRRADNMLFFRMRRDLFLRLTDFMVLPGQGETDEWKEWRQALRDLPDKIEDAEDVDWPSPPAAISPLLPHRSLWPDLDWRPLLEGK